VSDQTDSQPVPHCRVLLIQFAGDYREGYTRFASGGGETCHSQRYSVEKTAEIGRKFGQIGVLCCCCSEPYDEVMKDGVRAMGGGTLGTRFPIRANHRLFSQSRSPRIIHILLVFTLQ